MPHAIGESILIVEVQESENLSVLTEWNGFEIDGVKDGHLGSDFPTVQRRRTAKEELRKKLQNSS